ncbi:MAG: histidinol dehydrogenase [Actinomycetota bacterium]
MASPDPLTVLDRRGSAAPGADLPRPEVTGDEPTTVVAEIIEDVRRRGDDALRELTRRLDGADIDAIEVPPADVDAAVARVDPALVDALTEARESIAAYHHQQLPAPSRHERGGIRVDERWSPVASAGCYVPGGRARYPSTVLMTAVPARAAGVAEVTVCVPPDVDGSVPDETLAAAGIAGVDRVLRIGGAQAIAALAYGTASVDPVDVVVGPGNVYVAVAKQQVAGRVGVPSAFAGPSEIVVVADGSVPAEFAAVDVVVQAEHGPHGAAWLVTWDEDVLAAVQGEIAGIARSSPRRDEIESTLSVGGFAALVDGPDAALAVADAIAPEHLQLMCEDADRLADAARHAGAIFCGPLAPASFGDYVAGPSHVLPTDGTARFASALSVYDFLRQQHVVRVDGGGFDRFGAIVETLARAEGLDTHAESVTRRRGAPS